MSYINIIIFFKHYILYSYPNYPIQTPEFVWLWHFHAQTEQLW